MASMRGPESNRPFRNALTTRSNKADSLSVGIVVASAAGYGSKSGYGHGSVSESL